MRTRLLTSVLCLALAGLGATWAIAQPSDQPPAKQPAGDDPMRGPTQPGDPAQPAQPGRGRRGPGGPGGGGGGVGGSMKTMNMDVRALRSLLNDPAKKDEALRTIGDMERACATARASAIPQPVLGKAKDDTERAALSAKFRADLIAVMRRLLDADEHIAADKYDLARADLEEVLKLKDQGHHDMGLDDEVRKAPARGEP